MVEYISPKYEDDSFKEIASEIKELTEMGELDGISSKITEKGHQETYCHRILR